MVKTSTIGFMLFSAIISLFFPIGLYIYLNKKYRISLKVAIIGATTFVIFALILEQSMHKVILGRELITNKWLYAFYGAIAAGVFEEIGRFMSFKFILKENRRSLDGVTFGIGHGGIEAILIGTVGNIQNIIFAIAINKGTFDSITSNLPKETMLEIKSLILDTPSYMFIMGGLERIMAVVLHMGFSMIVLRSIEYNEIKYLFFAIAYHFLVDFAAALYQIGILNIWVTEILIFAYTIASIYMISRTLYKEK